MHAAQRVLQKGKCFSLDKKWKYNDNNKNNNNNKTTTLERQYNFTILMKGILKLFLGATSCKEIYDKDMLVDLIFGYYLCSTSNIPLSRNQFKPIASPNIP